MVLRFRYLLLKSMRLVIRNKLISIILILSFSLGLFFSAFVSGIGMSLFTDIREMAVADLDRTLRMSSATFLGAKNKSITLDQLEELYQKNEDIERIHILEQKRNQNTFVNGVLEFEVTLSYIDIYFEQLYEDFIAMGTFFNEDFLGEGECVIGQHTADKLISEGEPIGQKININGDDYRIVGITDNSKFLNSLMLSIHQLNGADMGNPLYFIIFSTEEKKGLAEFHSEVIREFGDYEFILEKKAHENKLSKSRKIYGMILGCSGIVLLFSLTNIINIVYFRIAQSQKRWAIALALGARKSDLYLQQVTEITIYTLSASVIVLGSLKIVERLVPANFPFHADLSVFMLLKIFSILISVLTGLLMLRKIMKLPVCDILRS